MLDVATTGFRFSVFTALDAVNWVLALVLAIFIYKLLSEMLFRDRGKFCLSCGLRDLPRNWTQCAACGMVLSEYVELVPSRDRRMAYIVPAGSFLVALGLSGPAVLFPHGGQIVVLAFVVVNAVFALYWLPGKDSRLRSMFNTPFWGVIGSMMAVVFFDAIVRATLASNPSVLGAVDVAVAVDGSPVLALRDGTLCSGVGPTAYPIFRGVPVRRLIKSGNGDVLVYVTAQRLLDPEALVGPTGIIRSPSRERVGLGLKIATGGTDLPVEIRGQLDRAAYTRNMHFCWSDERLWILTGKELLRVDLAGRVESFSTGSRDLGHLIKVAPGKGCTWLLSAKGVTEIPHGTSRKNFYRLVDAFGAVRQGQKEASIVTGAFGQGILWFVTSNGDVMTFDLEKLQIAYAGVAACPRYLDFYSIYTLPVILLLLAWTLASNFQVAQEKKRDLLQAIQ